MLHLIHDFLVSESEVNCPKSKNEVSCDHLKLMLNTNRKRSSHSFLMVQASDRSDENADSFETRFRTFNIHIFTDSKDYAMSIVRT